MLTSLTETVWHCVKELDRICYVDDLESVGQHIKELDITVWLHVKQLDPNYLTHVKQLDHYHFNTVLRS